MKQNIFYIVHILCYYKMSSEERIKQIQVLVLELLNSRYFINLELNPTGVQQSDLSMTSTRYDFVIWAGVLHLVVSTAEEVIPEALSNSGADPEDLGDVLPSDKHVSVVQLDVNIRLFVQQIVGPSCRS